MTDPYPHQAPEYVISGLALIADSLSERMGEAIGQNVGAQFRFGQFAMRDFCWCDDQPDSNDPHSDGCPPNFEYDCEKNPLRIEWYKTLGRSVRMNRQVGWQEWLVIVMLALSTILTENVVEISD